MQTHDPLPGRGTERAQGVSALRGPTRDRWLKWGDCSTRGAGWQEPETRTSGDLNRGGAKGTKVAKHEGREGWRRGGLLRVPDVPAVAERHTTSVGILPEEQTIQRRLSRGDRSVTGDR